MGQLGLKQGGHWLKRLLLLLLVGLLKLMRHAEEEGQRALRVSRSAVVEDHSLQRTYKDKRRWVSIQGKWRTG